MFLNDSNIHVHVRNVVSNIGIKQDLPYVSNYGVSFAVFRIYNVPYVTLRPLIKNPKIVNLFVFFRFGPHEYITD